ncbi:MAG: TonB-dependent receptor, partial [Longimicrobiales bacterium]
MSNQTGFALLALALAAPVQAQQRDSVRPFRLDPLVVSAERVRAPLNRSAAAISYIGARELAQRPVRTLAEALQQMPGLAFIDFDGNGENPQVMTRGFYGGGEAEYMLLLLDGQPINALETGRINWELIPVSAIESIEVVRGPASAAWGDAAVGGVIQINTRRNASGWRGSFSGGGHGVLRAAASGSGVIGQRAASVFGNYSESNGYRAHAQRSDGSLHAALALAGTPEKGLSLSTFHDWRDFNEPGALTDTELTDSRTQSARFYRFDHSNERMHRVGLDARTPVGSSRLSGSITGEYRNSDRIRTLRLAPGFADTKERLLTTTRLVASGAFEGTLAGGQFLLGLDASFASLDSEYFDYLQGPESVYAAGSPSRGQSNGRADGNRLAAAYFARYERELLPGITASVATRLDGLRDSFQTDAEIDQNATHHK